jgi:hypothetical protein
MRYRRWGKKYEENSYKRARKYPSEVVHHVPPYDDIDAYKTIDV